jgi:hypothetical protein
MTFNKFKTTVKKRFPSFEWNFSEEGSWYRATTANGFMIDYFGAPYGLYSVRLRDGMASTGDPWRIISGKDCPELEDAVNSYNQQRVDIPPELK